jgi:WD40 repeat protein
MVVSGSNDRKVSIWDTSTETVLHTLSHSGAVTAAAFSPDDKLVASASENEYRLRDTAIGTSLQIKAGADSVIRRLSFPKDGPYLETERDVLGVQPPCKVFVKGRWIT